MTNAMQPTITPNNNSIQATRTHPTQAELNGLVQTELMRLTDQTAPQEFSAFGVTLNLRNANPGLYIPRLDNRFLTGVQTLVHAGMQALLGQHPQYYMPDFDPTLGLHGAQVYKPTKAPQVATAVTVTAPTLQATNAPTQPAAPLQLNATNPNPIRW